MTMNIQRGLLQLRNTIITVQLLGYFNIFSSLPIVSRAGETRQVK